MRRSASEIINDLESRISQLEKTAGKFPPKAVDLNKLPDTEGFWNMSLSDLKAIAPALRSNHLGNPDTEIADIIMFLNMASSAWVRSNKGRKASTRIASDFDPRKAVVYFDLVFEDWNAEEDGVELSDYPKNIIGSAIKNIGRLLKVRVGNEGHDNSGVLTCKFSLDSLEHAEKLMETISRNAEGTDTLSTGVEYFVAQNFVFYPAGLRGDSYSIDGENGHEDLFGYLEFEGVI